MGLALGAVEVRGRLWWAASWCSMETGASEVRRGSIMSSRLAVEFVADVVSLPGLVRGGSWIMSEGRTTWSSMTRLTRLRLRGVLLWRRADFFLIEARRVFLPGSEAERSLTGASPGMALPVSGVCCGGGRLSLLCGAWLAGGAGS